ncbi:OB-fold nucleic acid binding domain-containing protein [Vallicoccus soli]|uniref:DNA-binding protein n=1 Tax=Vallicoccus soli TaxID=2339232 RepID=A0A3A3YZL2_9ACTN|nr:OB-fold nucleic acid binding domain-containing protein [Vallicoccus soli]RJK96261.1 DNA-binding protein [Vallicoccus soli]
MSVAAPSRLRRALARFASSPQELEAEELRTTCTVVGATPVAELAARQRVTVAGTLRTVTLRPRAGVPALVAELYDGSGTMDVVWLGRRQIPGIVPGRPVVAHGLVSCEEGRPTMYNPRYELRCTGPAQDG